MQKKISIIICTIGPNKNLMKLLSSISRQSHMPLEVIIVTYKKIFNFNKYKFKINIIKSEKKNQVYQRGLGLKYLSKFSKFILQLDNRIILDKTCLYELEKKWQSANNDIVGIGLNPKNHLHNSGFLNRIMQLFNLSGKVFKFGLNVNYSDIKKDLQVDWLKGGLSSWKKKYILSLLPRKYPNWDWAVGEDVDFSLMKKKNQKLIVCEKSKAFIKDLKKKSMKNIFHRGYLHFLSKKRISKKLKCNFIIFILLNFLIIISSIIVNTALLRTGKVYYNFGQIKALTKSYL